MTNDLLPIEPMQPVDATVRPPGSKSITNRAVMCAALARGSSKLHGVLDSEDTRVMIRAIKDLGIGVRWDRDVNEVDVAGSGGHIGSREADLFVANSGTTMRFLTALLTVVDGRFRIDGIARMRQRPIADLLSALNELGAEVRSEAGDGCPPVLVGARRLQGGKATIHGNISSQFLSGLLMAAPYARQSVELVVDGPLVSQPYVHMTCRVMETFGVTVSQSGFERFRITAPATYRGTDYLVEPDASAASYFWAAAAITGGTVTVDGLGTDALQGDVAFCDCLEQMGCRVARESERITVSGKPLRGISVDMNAISDTVQTLAVVALFGTGPTTITGVAHIRHKETDRIGDLARELRKTGATVVELPDGLRIEPAVVRGSQFATYNDHRMAMSLALVGLRAAGVAIEDPQCTEKTYPRFFEDLESLRG